MNWFKKKKCIIIRNRKKKKNGFHAILSFAKKFIRFLRTNSTTTTQSSKLLNWFFFLRTIIKIFEKKRKKEKKTKSQRYFIFPLFSRLVRKPFLSAISSRQLWKHSAQDKRDALFHGTSTTNDNISFHVFGVFRKKERKRRGKNRESCAKTRETKQGSRFGRHNAAMTSRIFSWAYGWYENQYSSSLLLFSY